MNKSLFNFYLDDGDKEAAISKLARLQKGSTVRNKGSLASCLRILIKQFVATPDDKVNPLLIAAIDAEYTYSQTKNKRSVL